MTIPVTRLSTYIKSSGSVGGIMAKKTAAAKVAKKAPAKVEKKVEKKPEKKVDKKAVKKVEKAAEKSAKPVKVEAKSTATAKKPDSKPTLAKKETKVMEKVAAPVIKAVKEKPSIAVVQIPEHIVEVPQKKVKEPKIPKVRVSAKEKAAIAALNEEVKKWSELKNKYGHEKAMNYSMNDQFEANKPIQHKVLGWGYVLSNQNDRLEVLFEQGIKILISNRQS